MDIRLTPAACKAWAVATATRSLKLSQLENRLLGGVYWTLVGTAAARGATLVASLVMARLLGRANFGEFGAIDSTIGMFAVFGNLGLSLSAIKFVTKYRHSDPARAGRILALCYAFSVVAGIVAAGAMIIAAPWLASGALASPGLAIDLQLASFVLLLSALNGTLNGVMLGLQAFRANGWMNVIVGLVSFPVLVTGAFVAGIRGAVVGLVVVQAVTAVAMVLALRPISKRHGLRPIWHGCFGECRTLLGFSLPALLNSSLIAPVNWLLVMLLVNYGGGYSELGLFQVANNWFLVLLFIPGKLSQVYYPLLEDLMAHGEPTQARTFVWKLMRLNFVVFGAFALGLTVVSRYILQCYGPEFVAARPALVMTMWTAVCVAVNQPLTAFGFAHSRMRQVTLCSLCWATVSITAFIELRNHGAAGAAAARLLGYCVYTLLMAGVVLWLMDRSGEHIATSTTQLPWPTPKAA